MHQPHLQNSSPIHSALSRKTPMLPSSISGFQRHLPHYSSAAVPKRTFLIRSTDPPQKPSHICHQTGFFRNFHHLHDSTFLGRGRHLKDPFPGSVERVPRGSSSDKSWLFACIGCLFHRIRSPRISGGNPNSDFLDHQSLTNGERE